MAAGDAGFNWRSLYATNIFDWKYTTLKGKEIQYRRLGIVENLFDLDGIDYEGRADLNIHSTIELKTRLTDAELRRRILLVWSCMRGIHPLLASKSLYREDFLPNSHGRKWIDKCFLYEQPLSRQELLNDSTKHATFLVDHYPEVNMDNFYTHAMNTSRVFDEKETLSRLFILPFQRTASGTVILHSLLVAGHEVSDGLTVFRMASSYVDLLNTNEDDLIRRANELCSGRIGSPIIMPPAQESLYPVYAKSVVRDRWNWAISRIFRHVRHPPPAAFQNPLRRDAPLKSATVMPREYSQVLNYAIVPPLNAYTVRADLSSRSTNNLIRLCKQAGISVGSGAFTLVGIIMMRFEEVRHPNVPYWERLPFVGTFPLNPRPFLSGLPTTGKENSLMLAFSDGVTLPFVPGELDFIKTFRVLGRLAHRQLRQYQKRKRSPAEEAHLGSRSPRELLPSLYLSTMERLDWKAKPDQRLGVNPQNAYPARQSSSPGTCGISSVGDRSGLIAAVRHDLDKEVNDIVADFQDVQSAVRPRDGEFLVGAIGTGKSMQFRASYDGSAIDPEKAEAWREAILSILEFDMVDDMNRVSTSTVKRQVKL